MSVEYVRKAIWACDLCGAKAETETAKFPRSFVAIVAGPGTSDEEEGASGVHACTDCCEHIRLAVRDRVVHAFGDDIAADSNAQSFLDALTPEIEIAHD